MAKTIKARVCIHVPAKDHEPFRFDDNGNRKGGKYSITAVKPGEEVTLDDKDAARILADPRFGAEEVVRKAAASAGA